MSGHIPGPQWQNWTLYLRCWVQGDDYIPAPAGNTISSADQDGIDSLGHLGALPTHIQPSIDWHPLVPFLFTVIWPLCPIYMYLFDASHKRIMQISFLIIKIFENWFYRYNLRLNSLDDEQSTDKPFFFFFFAFSFPSFYFSFFYFFSFCLY